MGIRMLLAAMCLCAAASTAKAQAPDVDCENDSTQIAMNYCAELRWQEADAELNRLWKILKPRADAEGWGQRLLDEQRAWLRARDQNCEAESAQFTGGSIMPQIYWNCMEEMTLRRNDDFRRMM